MVALPLSMALAIASGAPPQHGLYTAIVAGIAVALLGGSRFQVTGPTAAFVALLVPVVHAHGLGGLLIAGFMAGAIQVAMGVARLGRLIEYVPHPVTTGFTAGIAIVIASIQLQAFFGLDLVGAPAEIGERIAAYWHARDTWSPADAALGAAVLLVLFMVPRRSKVPAPFIALIAAALAAIAMSYWGGFDVATIGSQFTSVVDGETVRGIPPLPPLPAWPWSHGGAGGAGLSVDFDLIKALAPAAFAIAMLGAIESLLSAVVADATTGDRHDPDAELVALGVGNLLCPFFGGIPATAALARTATNIRAGARSPASSVVHALFVLTCTVALAPLVAYLPMAAMAALLLFVAYNMAELGHLVRLVRTAPRSDVMVLLTCFVLTIVFDMVIAVGVGVVLASLIFMRRMAEMTTLSPADDTPRDFEVPEGISLYRIDGPLFFGAAQRALRAVAPPAGSTAAILDMSAVPMIDATGMVALQSTLRSLLGARCKLILAGVPEATRLTLTRAGIVRQPGEIAFVPDVETALSVATLHAARPR